MSLLVVLACVVLAIIMAVAFTGTRITKEVSEEATSVSVRAVKPVKPPPVFLSTIEPALVQRFIAIIIVMLLFGGMAMLIPFGDRPLPVIPNFTPTIDAMLCGTLAIIAFILIGQFLRLRSWSLLVLVSGFAYKINLTLLHVISYPGFFFTNERGTATILWLYILKHVGFPLFVMGYAYFHATPRRLVRQSASAAIAAALTIIALLVTMMFLTVTVWGSHNPFSPADAQHFLTSGTGAALLLITIVSLVILWFRSGSVLDLWLMVSGCATVCNIIFTAIISHQRYDVGYYAGWVFELLSAGVILGALMEEMNRLYASLFTMMEQSTAQYRAIFDTASDAIIVINERGIVQSFNNAAYLMFGYQANEVINHNVSMLMPNPVKMAHDQYIQNYVKTGERKIIGVQRELQGKRKDGTAITIELTVAEWFSGDERRFTGMLRDISDRKRIETQLIQSQKMEAIGQLTGGMAHDFNNLLGVVMGNLDILAERFPDGHPDELRDALDASTAGADLVRRLLAFARRQPLQPKVIHIEEVVDGLLPLVTRIIGDYIVIVTHYDDALAPVMADPAQFENAVLNLIINSRDAMPHGGTLTIECRNTIIDEQSCIEYDVPQGSYTMLVVTDTGIGIPKEIMSHIFEPFFTTKPPGQGSGLGLSMVYGYAKQTGGVVRIYSELGKGTAVRLYLPISLTTNGNGGDHAEINTSALHGNERILIVEDTPAARTVAQRILTSLGYAVRLVKDASEALTIIKTDDAFDMLFTDIVMPGEMDGMALARTVRAQYPDMKILLTSGFSRTPSQEIDTLHACYITKPYRKSELALMLRGMFDE